jgi:hypothetical protein
MGKSKKNAEDRYRQVIMHSTGVLWERMCNLLDTLPDECNYDDLPPEQQEVVHIIDAIEHEWIIDDEARVEVSLLNWSDAED